MEEFLNKLYNYEYFGTYLLISIAVLVLLFIIILVFGKKDQKTREIEATKKLQQINEQNGFKETSTPEEVTVPPVSPVLNNVNSESLVNNAVENNAPTPSMDDTIIVPTIDSFDNLNNEIPNPVIPNDTLTNNEEVKEEVMKETPVVESEIPVPNINEIPEIKPIDNLEVPSFSSVISDDINTEEKRVDEIKTPEPILQKEEEKPFSFTFPEINEMEEVPKEPEFNEIKVEEPEDNIKENIKENIIENTPQFAMPNVSVSPIPEVEVPTFDFDSIINEIDAEKESKVKTTPNSEVFSSVYVPDNKEKIEMPKIEEKSDDDIELPTLKKEITKEDIPNLKDYNLNDLTGEIYTINR